MTLREQLRARERQVGALIGHGSIVSVSKNSTSQTYSFSGSGSITASEIARAYRTLIDLYDSVSAGIQSADDALIFAEMMSRLEPCAGFTKDFVCLTP